MKILLIVVLTVFLFIPLHAREDHDHFHTHDDHEQHYDDDNEAPEKKHFTFARQRFEFGFQVGAGVANDLLGVGEIFSRDIVLDLNKLEKAIGKDGFDIYAGLLETGIFLNIKNLPIAKGRWGIGFFAGAEGSLRGNIPQSIFTLISQGNIDKHVFEGDINVFGGIFAKAGLKTSAKYGKLSVGLTQTFYAPMFYIPKSGINFYFDTTDGIYLSSGGEISIYSPFVENGELKIGFDLSFQGEYALFSFLDVGGTLSGLPIAPASLKNGIRMTMTNEPLDITGEDLINGEEIIFPDFGLGDSEAFSAKKNVFRPMRFDVYARYKPFGGREIIVLRPNIGFTVDITENEGYFNVGAEAILNLKDLLIPYYYIGREEGLWKNRLGFAFNLRAFRLDMEAAFQSQSFSGSFSLKGLAVNLGLSFGW